MTQLFYFLATLRLENGVIWVWRNLWLLFCFVLFVPVHSSEHWLEQFKDRGPWELPSKLYGQRVLCISISIKVIPDWIDSATTRRSLLCLIRRIRFILHSTNKIANTSGPRHWDRGWSCASARRAAPFSLTGQTAVTGDRRLRDMGETLFSFSQTLGVVKLAGWLTGLITSCLFPRRHRLVLTVDQAVLALTGLRNEQDFSAFFVLIAVACKFLSSCWGGGGDFLDAFLFWVQSRGSRASCWPWASRASPESRPQPLAVFRGL